jgi:hypothetical protein
MIKLIMKYLQRKNKMRFDSPFNKVLWYKFEILATKENLYVIAPNFDDAVKELRKIGVSSSQYKLISVKA